MSETQDYANDIEDKSGEFPRTRTLMQGSVTLISQQARQVVTGKPVLLVTELAIHGDGA